MIKDKKYRLSSLAKNDLISIFDFTIQNWGKGQARQYAKKLSHGFEMLSNSPEIGKTRNELYENALSFNIGSHIIFYCINQQLDTKIEISRVLHQTMDFESHFK